jgi:hypothetical protein
MTIHFGYVPAGTTLYVPFHTFNAAGASVTISGLAITDIEIYKNGSVTQRASDNGYALLDTDGIDFDGLTGIHGFSIDTSDNSDSGFYAAGSTYWVVVSAVTVDSQTVSFVAATFFLGPVQADVRQYGGTAGTFSGGRPEVNTTHAAGTAWGSGAITAASVAADAVTEIQSGLATQASVDDLPTNAELATALAAADDAVLAAIGDLPTATENADALLNRDMSAVSDTNARSPLNALRFLRNKWDVSGGTLTVTKEDDSTEAWTAAVSTDAGAEPVIGSNPA